LEAVAATTSKDSVGWLDFASNQSARFEELEQAVFEQSRVLANLTAIDGALVLDKRFAVLGFGAEVSAELPTPARVFRALDTEGQSRQPENIENVGTRHRAAYRFVNDHPDGLAIVVSQDGGVSFVANHPPTSNGTLVLQEPVPRQPVSHGPIVLGIHLALPRHSGMLEVVVVARKDYDRQVGVTAPLKGVTED
jgi:hypothetical protein